MIATDFKEKWQYPNCIGALDGKHIKIKPPAKSGSYYFNYKHHFSIVLLAIVDANYKFIYIDVGCNGRISDGGVFRNSSLYPALMQNTLNVPHSREECGYNLPYVIVADEAFPLTDKIMKPFSARTLTPARRIFNYRLSRARRVVENAFGVLANRFRVFMSTINLEPEKVENIVLACCSLHNFLISTNKTSYMPEDINESMISNESPVTMQQENEILPSIQQQGSNTYSVTAKEIRETICEYFNSEVGAVSWQLDKI